MEVDESIATLGAKLDEWIDGNLTTFASSARAAQGNALLAGVEIAKELGRLKADGKAAITALLNRGDPAADDERTASLIRGFVLSARLADSLHDELSDTDGETEILRLMDGIVQALSRIGSGRAALAVLLNHAEAGVRASAGAYLIDLMPQRVVPLLREIEETECGNSAHFTAAWTILAWEREGKSRFNYLSK
jgi:hypothetical protein